MNTENSLMQVHSNQEELAGPESAWLHTQLHKIPASTDFVFLIFDLPVHTSSSDEKTMGGGHSSRHSEETIGKFLEEKQKETRAQFVVFNGHVHNYECHEHGGIAYFVTGGGAHACPILRRADDAHREA